MDKDLRFSVLLTVYNKLKPYFLEECLNSLVSQTLFPNQVVIIRDGVVPQSIDDIVCKFSARLSITYTGYTEKMGLGFALNFGLKYCLYNNIFRIDSDDICLPRRFELQMKFVYENPDYCVIGGQAILIDQFGEIIGEKTVPVNSTIIKKNIWMNPIIHPSVCFNKSKIYEIGLYNSKLSRRQDYELWFRVLEYGYSVENLSENLIYYRISNPSFGLNLFIEKFDQAIIGFKGCLRLGIKNPFTYIAVFSPILFILFPNVINKKIRNYFTRQFK